MLVLKSFISKSGANKSKAQYKRYNKKPTDITIHTLKDNRLINNKRYIFFINI